MPSSPNYRRDYKQERKTAIRRGETLGSDSDNAKRKRARRQMEKEGKVKPHDGKDVDHKKPLGKGGSNTRRNLKVASRSENRSFPRNKDGSMKSSTPRKKS